MTELSMSLVFSFAILGVVLLIVFAVYAVWLLIKLHRNKNTSYTYVKKIAEKLEQRKILLQELLRDKYHMDESRASYSTEEILKDERKVYARMLRLYVEQSPATLWNSCDDIDVLVDRMSRLLQVEKAEVQHVEEGRESEEIIMKKENKALRADNESMKLRLEAAMLTIDNMLTEYANLYESDDKRANMKQLQNEKKNIEGDLKRKEG